MRQIEDQRQQIAEREKEQENLRRKEEKLQLRADQLEDAKIAIQVRLPQCLCVYMRVCVCVSLQYAALTTSILGSDRPEGDTG